MLKIFYQGVSISKENKSYIFRLRAMFWFLLGIVIVVLGGFILVGAIKLVLTIIAWIINLIGSIFFDR